MRIDFAQNFPVQRLGDTEFETEPDVHPPPDRLLEVSLDQPLPQVLALAASSGRSASSQQHFPYRLSLGSSATGAVRPSDVDQARILMAPILVRGNQAGDGARIPL
jgi:hypothetical protein